MINKRLEYIEQVILQQQQQFITRNIENKKDESDRIDTISAALALLLQRKQCSSPHHHN